MILETELEKSWLKYLKWEFKKEYFIKIKTFLIKETEIWKTIYPKSQNIFNTLNSTSLDEVKVVIIGQDPYHGEKQAHGLSFSVQDWIKIPPSLKNIYKEIEDDLWIKKDFNNWNLTSWAKQWVLLLNAFLTVEADKPASHSTIWWENFTDKIIETLNKEKSWIIFLLWWAFAQKKESLIDKDKHYIVKTTHPSPFSAYKWFLWSKCFSKTNQILESEWKEKIKW
jgi:uracil-DNA glycosylase